MSKPLRLVIFDVDGTLVDSQGDIVAAMTAAFAAVDIYHDKEDAKAFLVFLTALEKISLEDYRTVEKMLQKGFL